MFSKKCFVVCVVVVVFSKKSCSLKNLLFVLSLLFFKKSCSFKKITKLTMLTGNAFWKNVY